MSTDIIILFFFFNDTATTEIYTLSLHDALPISRKADHPRYTAERPQPSPREGMVERALVLNASYQPICVVPVRRAVVLVLKEKADVLVPGSGLVRGATLELRAPSVIRLRYFVKVPFRARAGLSRKAGFVRDD